MDTAETRHAMMEHRVLPLKCDWKEIGQEHH